jgi:hypothetical protein
MGIFFNASLKKIPFIKMHIAIMLLLLFLISKGSKWGEGVKDLNYLNFHPILMQFYAKCSSL